MIELYADENFELPVVKRLREKGYDVLTTREAGKDNQRIPDEDVLDFAISQNRAVITLNYNHFKNLHCWIDSIPKVLFHVECTQGYKLP